MIIDEVLNRKDGQPYEPKALYDYVTRCLDVDGAEQIATALDSGENRDVQNALCYYIDAHEYRPALKQYIQSVQWI